jgi:hypothetical protein
LNFYQDYGTKLYLNDWCGSSPIFYKKQSFEIIGGHLKPPQPKPIDKVGLYFYLSAGYCIYGKTPYHEISYLRPNQSIENKELVDGNITYLRNLVNRKTASSQAALNLIEEWIKEFEESTSGKIVIPLSGGLDSRLLISFIKDKSRIEAFTYGQSLNQSKSNEVKIAESLSRKLNFNWNHVELKNYSSYTENWLNKWGASSHAHGMYQMQFYSKISEKVPKGSYVLSGIIGDLLAGSLNNSRIDSPIDILKLDLSRDMNAQSLTNSIFNDSDEVAINNFLNDEFSQYKEFLNNKRALDLLTIQNKNMLLRYLVEVPRWYGLNSTSPFLDENIGLNMLCIDENLRYNREWQKSYLKDVGLADSDLGKTGLYYNTLNFLEINSKNVDLNLLTNLDFIPNFNDQLQTIRSGMSKLQSIKYKVFMELAQNRIFNFIGRSFLRLIKKSYINGLQKYNIYLTLIPLSYIERGAGESKNIQKN